MEAFPGTGAHNLFCKETLRCFSSYSVTTEDEEGPIIGPRCLVAVIFTDYLCGVGDCRHEPSKQLFSSHSSEPFSSALVSTYLSKDKVPNPLWGSVGFTPALLPQVLYRQVLPVCIGVMPPPRAPGSFDLLPGLKPHLF